MTQSPEQIEAEIAATRESIKDDVDALSEKLDPRKAASRQADRVKDSVTQVKDTLMGTSSEAASTVSATVSDTAGAVSEKAGAATQTLAAAPARLAQRTSGNPWAMGLAAFALGWLASSLVPTSRKEREAAQALRESPIVEPVVETAKQVAAETGEQVKEAAAVVGQQAQEAVGSVGQHAKETVGSH